MKYVKIIIFFVIGLAIASLAEFWRFNIVLGQPAPWLPLLASYFIFLVVAFFSLKRIANPVLYYIIFAILGLLIEIFLLAQLPYIIASGIIGVISWLSFWGSVALIPRFIYNKNMRRFTVGFFFVSLVFFMLIQFTTNNPGSMGLFFISLNVPHFLQFSKKSREN